MFFGKKEREHCAACGRELQHRHKPMREWGIDGFLCGDCHLNMMRDYYEGKIAKKESVKCGLCGKEVDPADAYEAPRRLNLKGTLCRECFEGKKEDTAKQDHCAICGKKLGFFRYNPKKQWGVAGQLCRGCWDARNMR